ncbi:transcriptional regulator [Reichenbachiella sp. 5M10]|uniref:ArsR/SmtB family transcription factor n=1 Tax=Reichenbachiella sp. 5M10 TaxID=1889772 RepID=UPI000C14CE92|nr:metalloregulator ArsR/SmtB family transcription factor [Reichenbachiella sp. 5M10]PIB36986.1 transcriptional regulator [Reichenbachiella sp. 5M10]
MGITKSEIFTAEQNKLATWAKVLGHPARIAILQHMMETNACVCGDLVEVIGLAQPTISQHLRELKQLDLIKGNIEGTSICYCIHEAKWQEMEDLLTGFLRLRPGVKTDCC